MKRMITITMLLVLIFSFAACTETQTDPTQESISATQPTTDVQAPGGDVFYGMIVKNMNGTLLVTENKTEGNTGGLYTLSASLLNSEQDADMLVPGTYFKLYYGGFIMESYPAQFGSPIVFTCENAKEDLVTPLTAFISDLIPAQATWIALDLSGVENLSPGETEAIEYLLMSEKEYRCNIFRHDPQSPVTDLTDGAVLQITAQSANGKLTGEWTLTDAQQSTQEAFELSIPYYPN